MAGKKPATKVRKTVKTAARPAARKASSHRAAPRKTAAPQRKAAAAQRKSVPAPRKSAVAKPLKETAREAAKPSREPVKAVRKPALPVAAPPGERRLPPTAPAAPPPRVADVDEAEAAEPGSLLAGPRNVQPYIAKRGEQYMGKDQLAHFQLILSNWKRDLMEEVDRTVSHMKDEAANFPDPNDRATQEEEFSLELRTRDRERKLIRKIDEALKRIEDGSYGYCLETGEEIGIKRLEARPVATLSLEAQERRERRERQYGDRDDRYR
jgi:DnaK suppressor protein